MPIPSPGDLPNPGIKPGSPTLQADSLPAEPPGKPKYTRVGSLSLLQQIFPIQELNWGLLHCKQILYQLSYQIRSVAQSCPTLCNPMDCSLLGSSVYGFSRQEYWSRLPYPPPGDLPNPGIKPTSPAFAGGSFTAEPPGKSEVYSR